MLHHPRHIHNCLFRYICAVFLTSDFYPVDPCSLMPFQPDYCRLPISGLNIITVWSPYINHFVWCNSHVTWRTCSVKSSRPYMTRWQSVIWHTKNMPFEKQGSSIWTCCRSLCVFYCQCVNNQCNLVIYNTKSLQLYTLTQILNHYINFIDNKKKQ